MSEAFVGQWHIDSAARTATHRPWGLVVHFEAAPTGGGWHRSQVENTERLPATTTPEMMKRLLDQAQQAFE